ncbi:hypothetical protein B0H14DRAFT_2604952 [Mycena olivaceomarginata]|nr:hypothetical protein B0H14DRAFT_2604952 [Mycena olivaceomarginata]
MYKFTLRQLRSAAACEKQVSWFVGNQKAVLGITEGSGRVDLDQKDEQRKQKRIDYMESLLRGDKMGIHFLPEMFPGRYEPEKEPEAEWGIRKIWNCIIDPIAPGSRDRPESKQLSMGYTWEGRFLPHRPP